MAIDSFTGEYRWLSNFWPFSPELRQRLLDTGAEELIEGNYWGDRFWGVCAGSSANHLGKLLMKIRGELR